MQFVAPFILLAALLSPPPQADSQVESLPPPPSVAGQPWANPLRGGSIRILFIAPRFALADAAELEVRLQSRVREIAVDDLEAGLEKGSMDDIDIILLAAVDPSTAGLSDVLEQAAALGKGVVHVAFGQTGAETRIALLGDAAQLETNAEVTRGLGGAAISGWMNEMELVQLFMSGSRRIVTIDYPGPPPLTCGLLPTAPDAASSEPSLVESSYALICRAVIWAAHREPDLRIERVEAAGPKGPDALEAPPFLPNEFFKSMSDAAIPTALTPYRLTFNTAADHTFDLGWQIRYPDRAVEWADIETNAIRRGATSVVIQTPAGLGEHFLDVWVRDRKGVIDWSSLPIEGAGWPELVDFECSNDRVLSSDTVSLSFKIRPRLHLPRSCTVLARAVDGLGRIVSERYVPVSAEGGEMSVVLDFIDVFTHTLRIECYAADVQGSPFSPWQLLNSHRRAIELPVVSVPGPAFHLVAEGLAAWERPLSRYHRALASHGVDAIVTRGDDGAYAALSANNLAIVPGLPWSLEMAIGCVQPPVMPVVEAVALQDFVSMTKPYGSGLHAVRWNGSIDALHAWDNHSNFCIESFRGFLEREYGDLAGLNRAWGTSFAAWDDLLPPGSPTIVHDADRPRTMAFRTCSTQLAGEAVARGRDAIREIEAGARFAAIVPADSSGDPPDWWLLANRFDVLIPSATPAERAKALAYRSRGADTFAAVGPAAGELEESEIRRQVWSAFLHGCNGLYVDHCYRARDDATALPAIDTDFLVTPWFVAVSDSVLEIRSGYDVLLRNAVPAAPAVGIFDSRAAEGFAHIDPSTAGISSADFFDTFSKLGFAAEFVPEEWARRGKLGNYALVVLPNAAALADEDLVPLRAFQTVGGAVLADIAPGTYDGNGTQRSDSPLTDLVRVEPVLDLTVLRESLNTLGIKPIHAGLRYADETFSGERFAWHYGEAEILGFLLREGDASKSDRVRVEFPKESHPYDMRSGLALPSNRSHRFRLDPGEPALFAMLPYEVSRVTIESPEYVQAGRRLAFHVGIKTFDRLPSDHVVHVTLHRRLAEAIPHYTRTIECIGGQGEGYFSLAFNDLPGPYTLHARDLLSGLSSTVDVEITP